MNSAAKFWHRIRRGHWPRPFEQPEWLAGVCILCVKTAEIVETEDLEP